MLPEKLDPKESPRKANVKLIHLSRLGVFADLFETERSPLPEALLLCAVINRAIGDATSQPTGSYRHRQDRREARKWLWQRSTKQHGYGWATDLLGWQPGQLEKIHAHVFPSGTIDG